MNPFLKKGYFSAYFFIGFAVLACGAGLLCLRQTLLTLERPAVQDLLDGKWSQQLDTSFKEAMPANVASRNFWGRAEYALFGQGRKGVIIGGDGWLFTDEEFSCPRHAAQNLNDNLAFMERVKKTLEEKNVHLAVVLIPAKARVLSNHLGANVLPLCREPLYKAARTALAGKDIVVTDLLPAMQSSPALQSLYFKADTHWTPVGAHLAAQVAAAVVQEAFKELDLPADRFTSQAGVVKAHQGDLANYIPGVAIPADHFTSHVSGVFLASMGDAQNLFSDMVPPVMLVGTSYSANPDWNFEGFLKEALGADVLNLADQGQGPFVVMDKFLQKEMRQNILPRLVVWEVPERYLLMPHGIVAGAGK
jgi:alginate O-acetyltransferase complex protein AlgJ